MRKKTPNKEHLIRNIVYDWVRNDLAAASAWMLQLPDGETRDYALGRIARVHSETAPETGLAWALTMKNPQQRFENLDVIISDWKENDPKAAEAWVASSNLPAETKNKLLGK